VLSGDTVIVRGPPRGGPPPERTVGLSNVTAPRLARRPGIADESKESKDEVKSTGVSHLSSYDIASQTLRIIY